MKIKIIFFILIVALISCKGSNSLNPNLALLSALFNNKIIVILKATYASDRPLEFYEINNNKIFVDVGSNENPNTNGLPNYDNLPIFFDIGEIRVSTKSPLIDLALINTQKASEDFWDVLSPTRQVYCNRIYTSNPDLNSCIRSNGFLGFELLMNGTGVVYPSRDVGAGTYTHGGIFFRSVFTGYAKLGESDITSKFDGIDYTGLDILKILHYDPTTDSGSISILPPQLFPLHHKSYPGSENITIYQEYIPTIIEFRFNFKENLMVHAFQSSTTGAIQTFVGISDWRRPHNGENYAGGNLLLRMKMIYPSIKNTLVIEGGTYTTRHYYALYYARECSDGLCNRDIDLLPVSATPTRNGSDNILHDIMPGEYILQCRYDEVHDGYPEKVLNEIPLKIHTHNETHYIKFSCP
ncbi:MAG: hypothetical protein NZ853_00415 [Leptospiraceae bacterium]|nr:hypothetical protein [Leptospiraceae bacterium]MDW7976309.1 hypothetical protein [Leptospiraceae bacterium]